MLLVTKFLVIITAETDVDLVGVLCRPRQLVGVISRVIGAVSGVVRALSWVISRTKLGREAPQLIFVYNPT